MFSTLYFIEGVYFLLNTFKSITTGPNYAMYIFLLWALSWAIVEMIGQSKKPKSIIIYRSSKLTLISVIASLAMLVDNNLYYMLMFFVLTWLSSTLVLTARECKFILLEQLVCLGVYIGIEVFFFKNNVDKAAIIYAVVILLFCKWVVENLIKGRMESLMHARVQRQSAEDMVKVIDAKCSEARVATKTKSAFLANMSHEIRTPINAVLGLDEMILRESNEDNIKGYAHDIKSAGTTLLNLINDVLDFSKIESGKMELVPVDYDISSVLNDLVNMINTRAVDKGLSLVLKIDSSLPRILYGDEVRIKQIITNILTNAVKYTSEGYVTLNVGYIKTGDFEIILKVSVEDTGKGMKKEDIPSLFKPFERIEESKNRHIEGTGLGMSITHTFLNMMGSELEVQSEYGKGSTFSFAVKQEVVNWECMGNYEEAFNKLRKSNEEYHVSFAAPDAHVLVVDDVPLNLAVFTGLIKETRVQVDTANSGKAAIELCEKNKYDIVFMDHMMPEMDGIETFHALEEDENSRNKKTPFIILTANAVSGARESYISEGFEDYLSKPIDAKRLEQMMMKYIPDELIKAPEERSDDDEGENLTEVSSDYVLDQLRTIDGVDVDAGIGAVGDANTYIIVAKEFSTTTDLRCGMISDYYEAGDVHNYTIQVHGLKSSARLLGAISLSELARSLEDAGNAKDMEAIERDTKPLLNQYEAIGHAIKKIVEPKSDDSDKPLIEEDELSEALMVIKEGAESFDMDMINAVVEQLGDYRLPSEFKDKYDKLKLYISLVDFNSISELID